MARVRDKAPDAALAQRGVTLNALEILHGRLTIVEMGTA